MLPLDLALIPFAVVTAALTLYFSLLMRLKPSSEIKLSTFIEPPAEPKPRTKPQKQSPAPQVAAPSAPKPHIKREIERRPCPHYIGYLTTLKKGSPIPDECFGCLRVIQCLNIQPTKVIERFYLTTPGSATEAE